ncbi:MAG: aminotransferase class IV [Cyclobacteriaceae bacterium]|nr:aminotransferase class IV [Cyclobacteriaceae bacterium]
MDKSVCEILHQQNEIQLEDFLYAQTYPTQGLFKCRIIYDNRIHSIEFIPYKTKPVSSLKIIRADSIDYAHKFEDRSALHQLYQLREDCDDILIVKNGFLADSYYSNVILYDGADWFTPSTPLLNGTMRQALLKDGKIKEATIHLSDIRLFKKLKLINAMLGLDGPELSISQIVF